MSARKPHLTGREARWISQVDGYIRRYGVRGAYNMTAAFSDVHDGGLNLAEVKGLIRQRLLRRCPLQRSEWRFGSDMLGDRCTVDLTPRALRIFWPDRLTEAAE